MPWGAPNTISPFTPGPRCLHLCNPSAAPPRRGATLRGPHLKAPEVLCPLEPLIEASAGRRPLHATASILPGQVSRPDAWSLQYPQCSCTKVSRESAQQLWDLDSNSTLVPRESVVATCTKVPRSGVAQPLAQAPRSPSLATPYGPRHGVSRVRPPSDCRPSDPRKAASSLEAATRLASASGIRTL